MENKRHAFGQHFLIDTELCRKIVDEFVQQSKKRGLFQFLEIGPGQGALTHFLLQALQEDESLRLNISEKDRDLIQLWETRRSKLTPSVQSRVRIIGKDFLDVDLQGPEFEPGPWAVLSNLPYSVGTRIVLKLRDESRKFPYQLLMFQKEVADRLLAGPRGADRGSLSLWMQNQFEIEKFIAVPPRAFKPPPKVDSTVVSLVIRDEPIIANESQFQDLLEECFRHRRKMLRSSLSEKWKSFFLKSGVHETARAEELDWEDWKKIMNQMKTLIGLTLAIFMGAQSAKANVADYYGFGSRNSSLAGAGTAWGTGSYAAYFNPAQLGLPEAKSRIGFDVGAVFMKPQFTPIENVVVENQYTSDKVRYGNVDNNYRSILGQAIGLKAHLFPSFLNVSAGLTAFLPTDQVAYLDSGDAYIPEYLMYRSRMQRPQMAAGLGLELLSGLYMGGGFQIALNMTSKASVYLQTSKDRPSTMRFQATMVPKGFPHFGLLWSPRDGFFKDWSLGAVYRFAGRSGNTMLLNSAARILGNTAALDFRFLASSAIYYDPATLEAGLSVPHFWGGRLYLQVEQQKWSRYEAPTLIITSPVTITCEGGSSYCPVELSSGQAIPIRFKDLWVPRVAEEFSWDVSSLLGAWADRFAVRGGYSYRKSILLEAPSGIGNYVDNDKHLFTGGFGLSFPKLLDHSIPWSIDFHGAYQKLVAEKITKTAGDEFGKGATPTKIGSPGYSTGGEVFGGGVSLSLAI